MSGFRIGVTRDFLNPDGRLGYGDIGLGLLDEEPAARWHFLDENVPELRPSDTGGVDGLLVMSPRVPRAAIAAAPQLRIIARFGVGYDNIDIPACTEHGVLVTITPDGVRRPVAASVLTLLLALTHKLLLKDRLTRAGRWAEKLNYMGQGTTGRTLGVIGLGNIGREVFYLARPFGMRHLGFDPYVSSLPKELECTLVDLDTLLVESDYVAICCALNEETRHLINRERLARMKRSAYLINVARGPIIDEAALIDALRERRIQGAGLDVFEREPIEPGNPLLAMENVILAPHAICWTDECFLNIGRSACQSLIDVARGRIPRHIVNREALAHPRWQTVVGG